MKKQCEEKAPRKLTVKALVESPDFWRLGETPRLAEEDTVPPFMLLDSEKVDSGEVSEAQPEEESSNMNRDEDDDA